MENQRHIIRSTKDQHILIDVFKAVYPLDTPKNRPYYEHKHPEYEISTVLSGSGCYSCGSECFDFESGDIFLHAGNDNHCFTRIDNDSQLSLLVVRFEPRRLWSSRNSWGDFIPFTIFSEGLKICKHISAKSPLAGQIGVLLKESFAESQSFSDVCAIFLEANLLKIIAILTKHFSHSLESYPVSARDPHIDLIDQSIDFILSNLDKPLNLEMIAKEVGLSPTYYSTLFKRLNGVSVWSFITSHRIDRATQLLEHTDLPISSICEKCGFGSIPSFNRAFKQALAICPRDYRNQSKTKSLGNK